MCSNETEKASLENLKCDLQEILDLTRETLNELQGTSNTCEELNDEDDPYAQEMAIFMAAINNCETNTTENIKNQTPNELDKFKVFIETHFLPTKFLWKIIYFFRAKLIR